jgi:ABC-2 type transport system permease protein
MMFSGFIYEISSMPAPIRAVTYLFPARYFVTCMQTLFQAGDLWPILLRNSFFLLGSGAVLIGLTARFTRKRLD